MLEEEKALKEKFEELAKGEAEAAAVEAVLVGEVMVSDSSSSWTLAMLGERAELKPPKGPEPPGKVDSAILGSGGRGMTWLCVQRLEDEEAEELVSL